MKALGKVWLVGAGPGDPELLTVKATRVIAQGEVIFIDDLVDRAVLDYAQPTARIVAVGKRGGCRSTPQAMIERLMLREARAGLAVVRLKGGDPCLFGRGGEEQATLIRAGIEVEIVNGITAGIAAPSAFGIPVTHRDAAPGVIFVTGHTRDNAAPDWAALAATGLPLVIYMGVARAQEIAALLLAAGMAPLMPVAAISHATTPRESAEITTLQALLNNGLARAIESPAIIVIGEVVRYRAAALTIARQARQ
jgi:uroporphyrin-III C-methyltransferase